jgi:hypothetical protein
MIAPACLKQFVWIWEKTMVVATRRPSVGTGEYCVVVVGMEWSGKRNDDLIQKQT